MKLIYYCSAAFLRAGKRSFPWSSLLYTPFFTRSIYIMSYSLTAVGGGGVSYW
ncbi:hypothetical protein HMPREF1121_00935 [Porphyromonas sp. KLE 1280]|nr:hypothetical protein HMPREF1121_00935 [Porphyromonas sp. KLE 1280]